VVSPFNWSVNEVARPVGHFLAGAINYGDVVAQNQKLRYELGKAQQRESETWSFERQLEQVTTQLDVPFVGSLPTVAAQVTTLSPTNFAATVDIDKGRNQGCSWGCRLSPTEVWWEVCFRPRPTGHRAAHQRHQFGDRGHL